MPDPNRDIENDADEDGIDANALVRRLNRINGILTKAKNRLDKIAIGYVPPPINDRPPVLAALAAASVVALAVDLQTQNLIRQTPVGDTLPQ